MFQEALVNILSRLETARNRALLRAYALIGGFAVSAWGVPCATQDIDFAVAIGAADPQALANFMGGRYEAVNRTTHSVESGMPPSKLSPNPNLSRSNWYCFPVTSQR